MKKAWPGYNLHEDAVNLGSYFQTVDAWSMHGHLDIVGYLYVGIFIRCPPPPMLSILILYICPCIGLLLIIYTEHQWRGQRR